MGKKLLPIIVIAILIFVLFIVAFFLCLTGIDASANGEDFDNGLVGDTIQDRVWWALRDAGYSEVAAAAVMGNIEQESGFNTSAVNSSSGASGLCQWLGDRLENLKKFAKDRGVEWTDEETQILYLIGELTPGGGEANGYATYQLSGSYGYTKSDWENATDVETATKAFEGLFERSDSSAVNERVNNANKYYKDYKGKKRPSSPKGGSEQTSSTAGIRGYYKSSCSGRTFTEYYQNDGGAWDWDSGCWVCSQATIMSGFGSKYTPNQLPGFHGSAQQYTWKQYGNCNYERISNVKASDIKTYLKQGEAIHIRVEGRNLVTDNGTHYFAGHSLVLLDYKSENGKDKVYLHDPWKGDPTYGWTDLEKLASCLNWYEHVWQ